MKKKISIITWHTYNNYGGVMQSYALRKKLKNLEYQTVDLINYIPKRRRNLFYKKFISLRTYKRFFLNRFYKRKKNSLYENSLKKRERDFDVFREKNMSFTKLCENKIELYSLNEEYDKFICGSDQIWAPTLFDSKYFLDFVKDNNNKIAYAPSMGLSTIEDINVREKMKKEISTFSFLSVREERAKELIKELTNKEAQIVLDPTLLLNKDEWNNDFNLKEFDKNGYILIYCLGDSKKAFKLAKKFKKEIVIIPKDRIECKEYSNNLYIPSPVEFLKLIYNADLVITDSFHGTIFSMNFNVPFIVLKRFKDNALSQNSRIYNILKMTKSEDRLYKDNPKYFLDNLKSDFTYINDIIEEKRKESVEFLINSIESENTDKKTEKEITKICTGCGVCAAICPQNCISIEKNNEGFYQYRKNTSKCTNCGLCQKVCAQNKSEPKMLKDRELYSFQSRNEDVLKNSSSGGFAYELSKWGIRNNYKVIGCIYDYENNRAKHISIDSEEDILKLSGSKYLQSYTLDAFKNVLSIDKAIVIGTPCQIASLHKMLSLRNKRENFILVDLICHGVPSYLLWEKYLRTKKDCGEIRFRDKKKGWRGYILTTDGKKFEKEDKSLFYDFFSLGNIYNKACYDCQYRASSCADLRIGDFWGDKYKKDKKGVSMIIPVTTMGQKIIHDFKKTSNYNMKKEEITDYFSWQQTSNFLIPIERDEILNELRYKNKKLKNISNKYCRIYKYDDKLLKFQRKTCQSLKRKIKTLIRRKK